MDSLLHYEANSFVVEIASRILYQPTVREMICGDPRG